MYAVDNNTNRAVSLCGGREKGDACGPLQPGEVTLPPQGDPGYLTMDEGRGLEHVYLLASDLPDPLLPAQDRIWESDAAFESALLSDSGACLSLGVTPDSGSWATARDCGGKNRPVLVRVVIQHPGPVRFDR